jgi:2-polyprenyl-6-methoxyphenol hydroxylase-like FAD-dependent oxidoreductase
MLGYLLARGGVDAIILEKHADFLRDFRGDTVHPSTLELMYELGILDEFLKRPHQEVTHLSAQIGSDSIQMADFTTVPTHCKFVALMPQWDFLDFIAGQARAFPSFHLKMRAEATDLIEENGCIAGVRAKTPDGALEIRADLTVGADGRHSLVRQRAGLEVIDLGAPMDVMWMRISRRADDPAQTFGHVERGGMMVMLNREQYWQCAFVIPKGAAEKIREQGVPAFQARILGLQPFLGDRTKEIDDWKKVSVLTVAVDRLKQWARPGLLCIGDAAHAMSPIGGVGINLAIQDAVATANLLGPILQKGAPSLEQLQKVQERRTFPVRAMQKVQTTIQNNIFPAIFKPGEPLKAPWFMKIIGHIRWLRRVPARIAGVGFRPEHIRFPTRAS